MSLRINDEAPDFCAETTEGPINFHKWIGDSWAILFSHPKVLPASAGSMLVYPMSTGRNFDEVLRVLDSMQLTATHKVATPVNWKHGEDVIILPVVSDEEAKQKYPGGWKAPKPYLRIVPQPK
jgi:alkyl hydroperoxide reductase subunit AhpC